ncbi:MAG: hypothetical protein Q9211_004008 [Gyalolechia sp. 1 TL-2023]
MALRIPLSLLPFILHLLFLPQIKAVIVGSLPVSSSFWVVDESKDLPLSDTWWTGCHNRTDDGSQNLTLAHTVNTQACLDWYYWGGLKDIWEGTTCNDFGFFRGANEYSDSAACYEKCYGCLSQSIQAGSIDAICRDAHGRSAVAVQSRQRGEPSK